ncbi:unnamed protein product [Ostreobium quekettii]|uniref:F-box/LRR-repeat protein 15-like leucin rich repeat domain-containing protein n=1 Tax=Ostreobium quekettii TaxID=121088 RepID=A0A8S1IQY5_9CHLO|nr:unnamed protein product [Ostreobium quekettii]|eukprot:evm.model.scf_302.2 EVM.evm.TU.scf_302.2   scf_302:61587-68851(-)
MDGLETQLSVLYCATFTVICCIMLRMEEGGLALLAVLAYGAIFGAPMASFVKRDISQEGGGHVAWGVMQASVAVALVAVMALRVWNDRRARAAPTRAGQEALPVRGNEAASQGKRLLSQECGPESVPAPAEDWSHMPVALMGQVLRGLAPPDWRSIRLVCGEWLASSGNNLSCLQPSRFIPSRIVENFPLLQELDLHKCTDEVDMEGLKCLQPLKQLEVLDMGKDPKLVASAIDDTCIEALLELKKLHTLNLSQCVHVTNAGLELLARVSTLTSLSISGCVAVTDTGLAQLSRLAGLRRLEVPWCLKISDAGIQSLSRLAGLEELNLSGCQLISEEGICGLSIFTALRCLNLLYTGVKRASVSDRALAELACLTDLRQLTIGGMQLRGTRVSDAGLKMIASNHRRLTRLSLMWLNVGDEGLLALTDLPELRALVLRGCTRVTAEGARHLAVLPQLQDVNLLSNPWLDVTDDLIGSLRCLTGLQSLLLGDMHDGNLVTDTGIESLAEFRDMTSLSLAFSRWEFAGDALTPLLCLTALSSLDLQGCSSVNDATLRVVGKLASIDCLQLSRCEKVTGRGVRHLAPLSRLESLSLGQCHRVDDEGLEALHDLTRMSALTLSGCLQLTDGGIASLSRLSRLQLLDVSGCERLCGVGLGALGGSPLKVLNLGGCSGLTDEGLAAMAGRLQSRALTRLDMCYCGLVTDAGVAAVGALTSLTGLDLAYCCNVGDPPMRVLCQLPRLTTLKLNACSNLTDAGVAMLTRLERLLTVHLDRCQGITDKGLCSLSKCSTLTSLRLERCTGITDEGVRFLSSLTRLCILQLDMCPKVTEEGLASLSQLVGLSC